MTPCQVFGDTIKKKGTQPVLPAGLLQGFRSLDPEIPSVNWVASRIEPLVLNLRCVQDELYQNLIVEYSSGSALEGLEPHLSRTYTVHSNPPIAYEVKTLSGVYTTKIGSNVTKTYLAELKELAKQSGKDYVQKVVVEHIVRRQDAVPQVQSPVRLRSFSGKAPRPNNETDYDTWRSHIELLQTDSSMSPLQISRKIFESLLPPAADVVKGLRPESPPSAYLQLLDSAFGTVEDGEELFARFLNTLQDLAGQSVPYLGYVELAVTFPKELVGASVDVNTLALVIPDFEAVTEPLVLIGTNTLDVLYDIYSKTGMTHQPTPHGYRAVLKILEVRHKRANDIEPCGVVRLHGKSSQIIPAGETVVLEGVAPMNGFQSEKSVLIEHPSSSSLPGGLLVKAALIDLPQRRPNKLPVVICNESDHDIAIPAKCTIAQICTYQTILLKEHSVAKAPEPLQGSPETKLSQKPALSFNFGESPVPPEWKERITRQLNNMPDVFAQHDSDFGRTDKVTHHIKLSDETPFKLRPRPIHPQDLEAVRKHIQELLDAGVIRESESPFSSPIVVVRKKNGQLNRLELLNNVLYRRRQEGPKTTYQLVLPAELRDTVLTSLHDHMGHMGVDRTMDLVRSRFYWPRMAVDVERKVRTCGRCVRRKAPPERAAPLVNINTTRPLELLCMDFLSLEPDKSGTKDILVITDHFTKFAVAIPTPNQKARTVAKCLWENFMVHYGMPEKLHSDQGPDFESRMIKELCQVAGIQKVRTTPYHPRGNPVERFNRTLLDMLGTLQNQEKSRWRDFVKPLVHAYNCTRNDVTGFTPYELMFGRQPRLPVDLAFGLPVCGSQHTSHS
eukprot:superscaffoldBa00009410_g24077